jgi:signal transduction histidine kinase
MPKQGLPELGMPVDLALQLKIQNERFEYIAKATTDIIRDWDLVTNKVYWGEAFETRYGYDRSGPSNDIEFWWHHIHPEDRDRIRHEVDNLIKISNIDRWELQYQFQISNSKYIYLLDKAYIIRSEDGTPIRIVGALHDNTEVQNYELALLKVNDELERKAKELALSNRELERFAYIASHDLQEPLRMVSSFLELLKRNYGSKLDATADRYIDFAVDGAVRMKVLISDLLEYSRIGTRDFSTQMVDIGDIIRHVEKIFANDIANYKVLLKVGPMPALIANREQMIQLFQNLIGNAIKYRRKNENLIIEINSELTNNKYQFSVKDNGIGLDMKFSGKIFIIFQRLHQKEEYPGTGIGLAICSKIVNRHHGEIWVNSILNEGTIFYFTIADTLKLIGSERN